MRRLAVLLPLALAACVEGETPPDPGKSDPPLPPETACGAPDLQHLRGQPQVGAVGHRLAGGFLGLGDQL